MQTVTLSKRVTVIKKEVVEIENVEFVQLGEGVLSSLHCDGHAGTIGDERPIAFVWAKGRAWRLCRKCSAHLTLPAPDKGDSHRAG
jgi:hypothetical protein